MNILTSIAWFSGAGFVGLVLGIFVHELAHYIVGAAAGRNPRMDFDHRPASVWMEHDPGSIGWDVRVASAAPFLFAVPLVGLAALLEVWTYHPAIFGLTCGVLWRMVRLSETDVSFIMGQEPSEDIAHPRPED